MSDGPFRPVLAGQKALVVVNLGDEIARSAINDAAVVGFGGNRPPS